MAKANGRRGDLRAPRARAVHPRGKSREGPEEGSAPVERERSILELLRENSEAPPLAPDEVACPNCGAGMGFGSPVCPQCGNRIA
jgi:hypothetical protein